jgi:hypothetical protein
MDPLTHDDARDAEAIGEDALGRERRAYLQLAAKNRGGELLEDVVGGVSAADRGEVCGDHPYFITWLPSWVKGKSWRMLTVVNRRARAVGLVAIAVAVHVIACNAVTSVIVSGASFGGATADAHCDRRFVTAGGQRSAFCQEVVNTLAASQFADDCRTNHQATAGPGLCDRPQIIAGCKLLQQNRDGSVAWDWYYDVSSFYAEAGLEEDAAAGVPDGDAAFTPLFQPPIARDIADVETLCADPTRYPDGAELAFP